jgi:hypothetical protein
MTIIYNLDVPNGYYPKPPSVKTAVGSRMQAVRGYISCGLETTGISSGDKALSKR